MNLRNWLQLFRSQTASASFILLLTCFLLAGGQLFSIWGLALFIYAVLCHWWSFGENSLLDTQGGWDKIDKSKQHHPLVSGKIKMETAHNVIHTGIFILALAGILLIYLSTGNHILALIWFIIYMAAGEWYNKGFSKTSIWGFIPISICLTSFGLFGYFLIAGQISELMILVAIYIFLLIWFQADIEGSIKEINAKEANMLTRLGVKCNDKFRMGKARIYPWALKLAGLGVGGYIVYKFTFNPLTGLLFVILSIGALYFCHKLTKDRAWDRNKTLRHCASEEILTIYLMVCILMPVIGYLEGILLMVLGIVYFVIMNKINWGTVLRPQV